MKTKMTRTMSFRSTLIVLLYLPKLVSCVETTGGNSGGADCMFPYKYQDKIYYSCTKVNHDRPWCATTGSYNVNKKWGNCKPEDVATFGGNGGGQKCNFPYRYRGSDMYECTDAFHDQPWCATTRSYDNDKRWGNCGATAMITTEGNANNAPCCFPFTYKGVEFTGCTSFDSRFNKPWCPTTPDYDKDGQWGYCEIRSSRGNSNGANCVFPFLYNGQEIGRCLVTPEDSMFEPWCSTTYNYDKDKKWGYCIMQTTHRCEPSTAQTVLPGVSTTLPPISSSTVPPDQNTCVYTQRLEDTNAPGGTASTSAQSVEECMSQCDERNDCVGLDYDNNPNPTSRCWHHFDIDNLADVNDNIGEAPGVYHYRKLPCPGQPVNTCQFEQRDNTAASGASGIAVANPGQCRQQCTINENCVAFEWETNPNPNNNLQCFIHTDRNRVDTMSGSSQTVTQFIKLC